MDMTFACSLSIRSLSASMALIALNLFSGLSESMNTPCRLLFLAVSTFSAFIFLSALSILGVDLCATKLLMSFN